uniref:Putative cytoplasmic membrane-bounded vesicle n=1 Tax=Ixodes ricinus TaxID=34613 RepID=A0A131Y9H5_IXORI
MPTEWKEAQFSVPYGHLAAKLWGDQSLARTNVLALHGWRNNAGTFDTLVPLLSSDLYVVAVDLSGHGLSSHRPAGCSYSYHEYVMDVCRLVHHLGWRSFAILGHSFGCTVGMMYAALFPDRVSAIVALDLYAPLHLPDDRVAQDSAKCYEGYLRLEAKLGDPPVYTEAELMRRLDEATLCTLTEDSMRILLKRETAPCGSGTLRVTTDPLTKVISTVQLTRDYQSVLMERFRGDLLVLTASQVDGRIMRESMGHFFELYRRCCRRFEHAEVEGNHYVHLNQPEKVAPLVEAFLGGLPEEGSS